jgi:hypothetical protein
VSYQVFVSKSLYSLIHKHETLSKDDSIIGLWRFKRLISKEGDLRFNNTLNAMIKDYCGSSWSTDLIVRPIAEYVDDLSDKDTEYKNLNRGFNQ